MELVADAMLQDAVEAAGRAWHGRRVEVFDSGDDSERHFRSALIGTRVGFSHEHGCDVARLQFADQDDIVIALRDARTATFGRDEFDPSSFDVLAIACPTRRVTVALAHQSGGPEPETTGPARERAAQDLASALWSFVTPGRQVVIRDRRASNVHEVHVRLDSASQDGQGFTIVAGDHTFEFAYGELISTSGGTDRLVIATRRGTVTLEAVQPADYAGDETRFA